MTIKTQNIPAGYKQTDIGVIPENWDLVTYDEAFKFLRTASYSRDQLGSGNTIYIHYGDIHTQWDHFVELNDDLPTIKDEKVNNYSLIEDGDVIVADASEDYEGVCKSVEVKNQNSKRAISGLHTFLLRDKGNYFKNGFRGYIHSNPLVKASMYRLATGLKVYGVSKSNLKLIQIPHPPLAEQNEIANNLSDISLLISKLEKLIEKKINIKQGAMQELLTGKRRLTGFTNAWEIMVIGDLFDVKDGTHQTPKYVDEGIPFYSVESVTRNDFINTKYISHSEHKLISKNCKIDIGDILMTRIGSIGDCKLITWNINASFYVSLALLKPKDKQVSPYFYHFSKTDFFKKELDDRSLQWAVPKKINLGEISKVRVYLPSDPIERSAIASVLSDMDAEIEKLESQLSKYQSIKQGMMQTLLTGKIRLI